MLGRFCDWFVSAASSRESWEESERIDGHA